VIQRKAELLIIDPVLTMLGGNANKDQDARKALTPIRDMAERTGVAVIAVRRAKTELRVQSEKQGSEGWAWRLPDDERDHDDQDEHVDHLRQEAMKDFPYLRENDQSDQGDHRERDDHDPLGADKCIHGFASGEGCYLCDPNHPYRLKEGVP
jgi:hypothetical protein